MGARLVRQSPTITLPVLYTPMGLFETSRIARNSANVVSLSPYSELSEVFSHPPGPLPCAKILTG